jgi:hypothetical protein
LLSVVGLVMAPTFVFGRVEVVTMPEYWRPSESLGFFALVLVAFGLMVRFRVLRLNLSGKSAGARAPISTDLSSAPSEPSR